MHQGRGWVALEGAGWRLALVSPDEGTRYVATLHVAETGARWRYTGGSGGDRGTYALGEVVAALPALLAEDGRLGQIRGPWERELGEPAVAS